MIVCFFVYSNDIVIVTRVTCGNMTFIFCNIYLPSDDKVSHFLIEYEKVLGEVQVFQMHLM